MRKKTDLPVAPKEPKRPLYIVTDRMTGYIHNRQITHERGEVVYLSEDEAKAFKDSILELPNGLCT